jgi:hypothetical protein
MDASMTDRLNKALEAMILGKQVPAEELAATRMDTTILTSICNDATPLLQHARGFKLCTDHYPECVHLVDMKVGKVPASKLQLLHICQFRIGNTVNNRRWVIYGDKGVQTINVFLTRSGDFVVIETVDSERMDYGNSIFTVEHFGYKGGLTESTISKLVSYLESRVPSGDNLALMSSSRKAFFTSRGVDRAPVKSIPLRIARGILTALIESDDAKRQDLVTEEALIKDLSQRMARVVSGI